MQKLEDIILGHLILQPELLQQVEIDKRLFSTQRQRQVFNEIKKGNTDAALIAQNIGGKNSFTYVSSLFDSIPKTKAENLQKYVDAVKRDKLKTEIVKKINKELKYPKSSFQEIRKDIEEYDKLGNESTIKIETLKNFREREIPGREIILQYHAEKESLSILAGPHKRGKSIYCLQMGICIADGRDFLDFEVPKPRRVLLYQQEISESSMKERIDLILSGFDSPLVEQNFMIKNTIGDLIKITKLTHKSNLFREIERNEPDLVIFDPLSTFHNKKENDEKEMSEVIDIFYEITKKFKVGVFLIHHYGKPSIVQREGGHRLRGHSILGDRPDIIILFNTLPEKYKNSPLPFSQQNYAEIEFVLRSDVCPDNYIIERDPKNLQYHVYDLYGQLGKKILPEHVRNIVRDSGGEMFQVDLVNILLQMASRKVVFKAIEEAKNSDYIETEIIPEKRGNPMLVRLKKEKNSL